MVANGGLNVVGMTSMHMTPAKFPVYGPGGASLRSPEVVRCGPHDGVVVHSRSIKGELVELGAVFDQNCTFRRQFAADPESYRSIGACHCNLGALGLIFLVFFFVLAV